MFLILSFRFQEQRDDEATGFSKVREEDTYSDIHDGERKSADADSTGSYWIGRTSTQLVFRILFAIFVGIALAAASLAPGLLPNEHIECLRDEFFVQTQQVNDYFATHEAMKFAFLIF